jgi:DNA-binding response OmpR family regulator
MSLLIVESDDEIRDMLQWAFASSGVESETVDDGRRAVAWLEQCRPSAVILDLSLPYGGSDAVTERLQALYGPEVPLITMSADVRRRESDVAGARAMCFEKPFDVVRLVDTVSGMVCAFPH